MKSPAEFYSLSAGIRALAAPGGGVFLVSEAGSTFAAAPLVAAVVALADGARDLGAIVAALPGFAPAEVIYALNTLAAQGVLSRHAGPPEADAPGRVFEKSLGALRLVSDNRAALATMAGALRDAGIGKGPALTLVLCADYLGDLLSRQTPDGSPWLPVKLAGRRSYFGPVFGPVFGSDHAACLSCLQDQLRRNRPVEAALAPDAAAMGLSDPDRLPLAPTAAQGVAAVVDLLTGPQQVHLDGIVEPGPGGARVHQHRCTCAPGPAPAPVAPALQGQTTFGRHLGGFRSRAPGEIAARLAPLVSDLTGLVSSHGPLDCGGGPAPRRHVWAASYPITPRARVPGPDAFHGVAMGKGLTAAQAEASALCEAVERLSALYRPGRDERLASLQDLGPEAIDPNAVWQFSPAQFAARAHWNALSGDERRQVPAPLAPGQDIAWLPVWSLTEGRRKWMARDLCFANAPEPRHGRFDPNGCAAGASLPEAAVQGLLELVERDSVAIWWYNRLRRPGIDPRALGDPRLDALADGFAAQGWNCWLLDLATDLAVPCFAALARAESDGRWCIGFGCHVDAALAAERAMSELAQLFRADGRDGPPPWARMSPKDEDFLFPHGAATLTDAPTGAIATFEGLLGWAAERLAAQGIETLVLDQSHPETGLSVVKVFAPGLRHFWPRFAPGRLYDVPPAMGWRGAPLAEDALNPVHLFL